MAKQHSHADAAYRRGLIADAIRSGKTVDEVASEFGVSRSLVSLACAERWVLIKRKTRPKKLVVARVNKWESIDWSKRNTDIALELGVTKERVRQVRNEYGKKKSEHHWLRTDFIAFREWAQSNIDYLRELSPSEIHRQFGRPVTINTIHKWCVRIGVKVRRTVLRNVTRENLPSLVKMVSFRPGMTECWELNGNRKRYPRLMNRPAHKAVFELFHGKPPEDKWVLHRCDNKACVNPEHLYAGTAKDNAADRMNHTPTSRKLTSDEVHAIRQRRMIGGPDNSLSKLAVEYGVCVTTVYCISSGRTHKDIAA